jgi:hypothetical protein
MSTSPISVVPEGDPSLEAPPPVDAAPDSLLARLRQQAARQREERHIELEIGGWFEPPLIARYGVLPVHELERMNQNIDTQRPDIVGYGLEVMARSNSAILARDGERLIELRDERGAVTFGLPIPPDEDNLSPREVIVAVFGGNALALNAHGGSLIQWMQNPGGQQPGEASGARA